MRWLLPCASVLLSSCNLELGIWITPEERDTEWMRRCREALDAYCVDEDGDAHTTSTRFTEAIPEEDDQRAFCESRSAKLETQYFYVPDCVDGDDCDTLPKYTRLAPCSAAQDEDCDDSNASVFPGQSDGDVECDRVDNDCDGEVDEDGTATTLWYPDADGDGYGDALEAENGEEKVGCESPGDKMAMNAEDCDDEKDYVHPGGADLVCSDGIDGDCDGQEACALDGAVSLTNLGVMQETKDDGIAVASGDSDDDGIPDLAVVGYDGKIEILGAESIEEPDDADGFGTAVAVGDWDGNGSLDIAVGAPAANSVLLFAVDGTALQVIEGNSSREQGGAVVLTVPSDSDADWLAIASAQNDGDNNITWKVYILDKPGSTSNTSGEDSVGTYSVGGEGALSLSASASERMFAVGYSTKGADIFWSEDLTSITSVTTTASDAFLGASVLLADVMSTDDIDVLIGAPGSGVVYGYQSVNGLADALGVDSATTTWTGAFGSGAGLALVNDLNGDGEQELVIGADGALYLLYGPDFSTGNLETIVHDAVVHSAKVTGFAGPVRQIVSAGDLDGDTYNDMLVTDGQDAYILYGGPP